MSAKNRKSKKRKPPKRQKPALTASQDPDRLLRRVTRVRPFSWTGEVVEDVAVFDDAVLAELPPETAGEVTLVREALQLVRDSFGSDANKRLATIARRSPLSEWRLFVRGLVEWYDSRAEEAQESWKRLDAARRPSRIARALTASGRNELDALSTAASSSTLGQEALAQSWDSAILSAAKLVRQARVDRPAIVEAERETSRRERLPAAIAKNCHLGPERLDWLIAFCNQYRQLEPQLIAALQQSALERVMKQPYADVNQIATAKLPGPAHDPKNLLSQAFYHQRFEGGETRAESFMQQYLTKSLNANDQISPQLRAAITSEIYLDDARDEAEPESGGGIFGRYLAAPVDLKQVSKKYKLALEAYPANAEAHREYVDWIREHAEDEKERKSEREPYEKLLLPAMIAWADGVPEEIEPRLWLVDHYLENEELEAARPHVQWLALSRHADPRVRATPWKWELLEAMRLCRRKTWLSGVAEKLDAAEKLWPVWLTKDWLPYLRAALLLRQGKSDDFSQARSEIRQQRDASGRPVCDLTDAVMMLSAAQLMRVPTADLKPLRAPVDEAVKMVGKLAWADLVQTASFFWDLQRVSLRYPAYRMHGGKFAAELNHRLKSLRKSDFNTPEKESLLRDAVYWLTERRIFNNGHRVEIPRSLERILTQVGRSIAIIQAVLLCRRFGRWRLREHVAEIGVIRKAASTEKDSYYRYWFNSLADRADEELAKSGSGMGGFGSSNPFGWFAAGEEEYDDDDSEWYTDDVDDDDGDDEQSFDPNCDCPTCTAARARAGVPQPRDARAGADASFTARQPQQNSQPDLPLDLDPPKPPLPRIDLPPDPVFRRTRPKDPMGKKRKKNRR